MLEGTVEPLAGFPVPRLSSSLNSFGILAVEVTVAGVGSEVSKGTSETSSDFVVVGLVDHGEV